LLLAAAQTAAADHPGDLDPTFNGGQPVPRSTLALALVLAFSPSATAALKCRQKCAGAIASCRTAVSAL
jgi:hypothetical protein